MINVNNLSIDKGVAIPYIIALVIGIIVVVIVVYWIYRMFTSEVSTAEECKSKFMDWCILCLNKRWIDGSLPKEISDCLYSSFKIKLNANSDCASAKKRCNEFGIV